MKSNAEQWNYLDSGEIEYYTKQFSDILESEKSDVAIIDLVFSMSNKPLFETLYNHFSKIFPSMQKWETPCGQFFTFGEKGKARLKNLINARLIEIKEMLAEYEKTLNKID